MKSKLIAVDFDGTCVMHEYPRVGADVPHAVRVLRRIAAAGHEIILWTMRSGAYGGPFVTYNSTPDKMHPSNGTQEGDIHPLRDAVDWFLRNQIRLNHVNCNPHQDSWSTSRKVYAHFYIDDAALGTPLLYDLHERPVVDWLKAEELLERSGILKRLHELSPISSPSERGLESEPNKKHKQK